MVTVTIPPDTDQRIREGRYPPCRRCDGLGIIYRPERNDAGYDEHECSYCFGQGVRIPITDVCIDGHRLKETSTDDAAHAETDRASAVADPSTRWTPQGW